MESVKLLKKWAGENPIHPSVTENGSGFWKQAFVCAGLGPWQTGHNQAIVCLGKATASYCNYLWKKIFDVFGRGWVWGDVGGRAGGSPLGPSTPEPIGCRGQCYVTPGVWVFRAEKFETSPALVPGMEKGWPYLAQGWYEAACPRFEPSCPLLLLDAFLVLFPAPCVHCDWSLDLLCWFLINY